LSKNKPATKALSLKPKKIVPNKTKTANSNKTQTKKQNQTTQTLLDKKPKFKKLNPETYAKLQSTINEVIEKTLPEYKEWLNSAFGEKIILDHGSKEAPILIQEGESVLKIDQMVVTAFNKVMTNTIRNALETNEVPGIMETWFKKKFTDDLSDIRPENRNYYKHCVQNFVVKFFSKERIARKKILDFGCGPGYYSTILAQSGAQVTGIDRSSFLIQKANELKQKLQLKNIEFIKGDFLDFATNVAPKEFDYIIAIDTIVSFDYSRQKHNNNEFTQALSKINKLLKDQGRFFIIEAHPFFGQLAKGIKFSSEGHFHGRLPNYKIEFKAKNNPHHWFTLDEMTSALSENGLAICRIYEPDPSVELEKENAQLFKFFLKYPHLIVYEICKVST
jgi:2-polyprenyl-3-methyl-5-hydroxy-6-metoxy-1,4-benzoquinol methylase